MALRSHRGACNRSIRLYRRGNETLFRRSRFSLMTWRLLRKSQRLATHDVIRLRLERSYYLGEPNLFNGLHAMPYNCLKMFLMGFSFRQISSREKEQKMERCEAERIEKKRKRIQKIFLFCQIIGLAPKWVEIEHRGEGRK